ncbi:AsmA family protein [Arenimonas oryziterrae]|uniref:AsmA domain-containing protein n=1 Tax=Arenimonas oryziterrae DSM 21050 = YC6267 TaxID=1121015 RepID=A0A091BEJ6_9GAMM|nr:AsmA family protein [Arenimonas oryziterrae]KFN42820.1 hypothetical protein N789_11865 [Arenimonas oryziterrae DSM 21050 = YC6267]
MISRSIAALVAVSAPGTPRPTTSRDVWIRRGELLLAAILLVILAVMLFDWNMLRGPIGRRVTAATGREFRILGDLDVDLGWQPRILADRVYLANAPGAKEPRMASAERVDMTVDLRALLHGDVVLPRVTLRQPVLLLELDAKGHPNWDFDVADTKPFDWPLIRDFQVGAGRFFYRNPKTRTNVALDVHSGEPEADSRIAALLIDGKGVYGGNPFTMTGRVESPLELAHAERPYRIDLQAKAGATRATARGELIGALQLTGFDLDFGLSGPDMALLYPLIGVATPNTPPYHLRGRLRRVAHTWMYDNFKGVVGDSDLAGDASVETGGARPFLRAHLVSKNLDFDDLGGFVGAPPQTGGNETASAEQKQQAAALRASPRVLPDDEFHLEKLRNMDADVSLKAEHLHAPSLPLEAMTAHLFVDDGVLRLDPLNFSAAGGEIESRIRLDAREPVIRSSAQITARGLSLPKLFPDAKLTESSTGRIGGSIALTARGNSVARMLASSDGEVGLMMGKGQISNLLMEFAGLDIYESLKFLIGKDRTVPIRCAFADFDVDDGLMTSKRLVFDTSDTAILGEGTISLDDESLDLHLKPKPKDHSLFSLRSPLIIGGTFKDPSFRPDAKALVFRGGGALALASLAPPAALLALFETGPGKDSACEPLPQKK